MEIMISFLIKRDIVELKTKTLQETTLKIIRKIKSQQKSSVYKLNCVQRFISVRLEYQYDFTVPNTPAVAGN